MDTAIETVRNTAALANPDALAFFLVLAACVYAAVRVWRDEHRYS